jgi:hypothetical protein
MKDNMYSLRRSRYLRYRHFAAVKSAKPGTWIPMKTTRAFKGDGRTAINQVVDNEPSTRVSSHLAGEGGHFQQVPFGNQVAASLRCMDLPARKGRGYRTERPEAVPRLPKETSSFWPGMSRVRVLHKWPKGKPWDGEFKVEVSIAPVEPRAYLGSRPKRGGMGTLMVGRSSTGQWNVLRAEAPLNGRAGRVGRDGVRIEYPVVGPFEQFEFVLKRRKALKLAKTVRAVGKHFWMFPRELRFPEHLAPYWAGRGLVRRHAAKVKILPKLKPLETSSYQVCNGCRRAFPPGSFIPCKGGPVSRDPAMRFK